LRERRAATGFVVGGELIVRLTAQTRREPLNPDEENLPILAALRSFLVSILVSAHPFAGGHQWMGRCIRDQVLAPLSPS
jgi:hypothetical protein